MAINRELEEALLEGFSILNRVYFNVTMADHAKKNKLVLLLYLATTWIFPKLRWIYIIFAQKTSTRQQKTNLQFFIQT